MPEFKPHQQTFTIKFDPNVQAVSDETAYLRQWIEIIEDYNKRVQDYPRLREIGNRFDLSHISKEDRIYFQEFIDHVNRLLDSDLPVVKQRFFTGVWKLGVGVSSADPTQVCFQLYAIALGDTDILVSGIPQPPPRPSFVPEGHNVVSSWLQGGWPNESTVQYHWRDRSALKCPQEEAQGFVFHYLTKMLRAKALPLYGKHLSVEYLFWFVDRFGQSLGVRPSERLRVADLEYGVHVYLPAWASVAVPRYLGELIRLNKNHIGQLSPQVIVCPPFECIAGTAPESLGVTKEEVMRVIQSGRNLAPTRVSFSEASPHLLAQAVDFLTSLNEEWIERPYRPRCQAPKRIWSGYSPDALRHNISGVLIGSVDEYRLFVERNQIPLGKSFSLHQTEAIIHVANFSEWAVATDSNMPPLLHTYTVKNEDKKLPEVTLIDPSQTPGVLAVEKTRLKLRDLEVNTQMDCDPTGRKGWPSSVWRRYSSTGRPCLRKVEI